MLQPNSRNNSTSSKVEGDEGDPIIGNTATASEKQKWNGSSTLPNLVSLEELQKQLQQREQELQTEKESKEELEQKVKALESQTPVMQKLTAFVSTQRALEQENQDLREQLENYQQPKDANKSREDLLLGQEISTLQAELEAAKKNTNYSINANVNTEEVTAGFTEEEVNKLLDEEQEKYQTQLEAVKQEHSVQVIALQAEKEALQEKLEQSATITNSSNDADVDLIQLQAEMTALKQAHAKEMDEILAQLDLVEAEHKQELERVQTFADEQAAMVTALSHELASNKSSTTTNNSDSETNMVLQKELSKAKADAQYWQDKCQEVKAHYKQLLQDERQHTLEEADKARQETIQEAEAQFQQANDLYVSLKQEYAECNALKDTLEHELVTTRHHHAEDVQELEHHFQHQIEQLQQELSNVQSTALQDKHHFTNELERFQKTHDLMVQELEDLRQDYQAMEKTYAHNISEKERLIQENADLKTVCEETMALMEQYQQS